MKVAARDLYLSSDPSTEEAAVLDLSRAIHEARSDRWVISWEAQLESSEFFNANGLISTIDEILRLRNLKTTEENHEG